MPDSYPPLRYHLIARTAAGEHDVVATTHQRTIDIMLQTEPPELHRIHIDCPAVPGIGYHMAASEWRDFPLKRREIIKTLRRDARRQLDTTNEGDEALPDQDADTSPSVRTLDGKPAAIAIAVDKTGLVAILVMGPEGQVYEEGRLSSRESMQIADQIYKGHDAQLEPDPPRRFLPPASPEMDAILFGEPRPPHETDD